MERIETLAQSIGKGNIPIGGGVLLLFPALMRLIGFDMVMSYNTFIFTVNLGTAVIAYLCFKGCFRDSRVGMAGSLLYTLAPYRIYHIYDRGAVGEYTAMVFLPLLVYGFYQIFAGGVEQKGYRRGWLMLALGFGGFALSHMLLYEIAAISGTRFQGRSFLDVMSGGIGMAILLGVGAFWLIRDICRDKRDKKQDWVTVTFFSIGVIALITGMNCFPWEAIGAWNQIAATIASHGKQFMPVINAITPMENMQPQGVGFAVTVGVLFYLWLAFVGRYREKEDERGIRNFGKWVGMTGAVIAVMTTNSFPWDYLQRRNSLFFRLVESLQSPARLVQAVLACFVLLACTALWEVRKWEKNSVGLTIAIVIAALALWTVQYLTGDILRTGAPRSLNGVEYGNPNSEERFLPENLDISPWDYGRYESAGR